MIKAIIYDLDDTMVDSIPLHLKSWDVILPSYGHSMAELPAKLQSTFIGMRVHDIEHELVELWGLDPAKGEKMYVDRTKAFMDLAREQLQALPGMRSSLDMFKQAGYKLAMASSGTKEYIDLVINRFELEGCFDLIISGDDVQKGKPDPETYLLAAQRLGLQPQECLVLEDATVGVHSAKSAGCYCVAVRNRHTPKQDLSAADLVVDSLTDVKLETAKDLAPNTAGRLQRRR